jgi:hypothetical protein
MALNITLGESPALPMLSACRAEGEYSYDFIPVNFHASYKRKRDCDEFTIPFFTPLSSPFIMGCVSSGYSTSASFILNLTLP